MSDNTLEYRAKGYYPGETPTTFPTLIVSGFATYERAEELLVRFIDDLGCTGGHIERHVQGIGWVVNEDDEPVSAF